MRQYVVLVPAREDFKNNLAMAALNGTPLPVTARECLDDLTARRRSPKVIDFRLQINSVHLRDGAFVIAELVDSPTDAVRLDFNADGVIMTVIGSDEPPVPTP